jgi:hypothetical protein
LRAAEAASLIGAARHAGFAAEAQAERLAVLKSSHTNGCVGIRFDAGRNHTPPNDLRDRVGDRCSSRGYRTIGRSLDLEAMVEARWKQGHGSKDMHRAADDAHIIDGIRQPRLRRNLLSHGRFNLPTA